VIDELVREKDLTPKRPKKSPLFFAELVKVEFSIEMDADGLKELIPLPAGVYAAHSNSFSIA